MNINNEEKLKTLEEKIADARMLLSVTEQELIAIQKAVVSEKYVIQELIKQKNELEGKIEALVRDYERTKSNMVELNTEFYNKKSKLADAETALTRIEEETNTKQDKLREQEQKNTEREQALVEKLKELHEREQKILEKEKIIEEKIRKIQEFISQI